MLGKKNEVHGEPGIAHPAREPAVYVEQCCLVLAWFREMFTRVERGDKKAAAEARFALANLLLDGVSQLLGFALRREESKSKRWAGELLAYIVDSISKFDEKKRRKGKRGESAMPQLCKVNAAYQQAKERLGRMRRDMWFPTSPLYVVTAYELWHCFFYQRELILPKAQVHLKKSLWPMPEEYQPFLKLPPLSPKSWKRWEPELWKLVKRYPDLLQTLRRDAAQTRGESLSWSNFRGQFRKHVRAYAKLWCGTL
jgi:hypothetical protein